MGKMLELPDEVYAQLERQAQARGLTIAQLIAQREQEVERACLAAALERLRVQGLLASKEPIPLTPTAFKPITVQGKPLSEVILEERR